MTEKERLEKFKSGLEQLELETGVKLFVDFQGFNIDHVLQVFGDQFAAIDAMKMTKDLLLTGGISIVVGQRLIPDWQPAIEESEKQ